MKSPSLLHSHFSGSSWGKAGHGQLAHGGGRLHRTGGRQEDQVPWSSPSSPWKIRDWLVVSTQQDWLGKWWFIWKINTIFSWVNQLSCWWWLELWFSVFFPIFSHGNGFCPWFFRGYHRFHYDIFFATNGDFTGDLPLMDLTKGTWGICFRGVFEEKGWILPWRTWRMVYWRWKMVLLPRKGVKIPSIMVNLPRNMVILSWKTCGFTQTHAEFTKKKWFNKKWILISWDMWSHPPWSK